MAVLVSLSTYKALLGITGTANDFALNTYVDSASQLVKTYCNNSFVDYYSTDKVEEFTVNPGQNIVQLGESPALSITRVTERTSPSATHASLTPLVSNTDYYLDTSTDSVFRVSGSTTKAFISGMGSVSVSYKAGYNSVPEDLKLAVVDIITYYYKDESKTRQTMAGSSRINAASSTMRGNIGFPDHIKRVLDLYKNY
jgi:hypothetical protein|tara:strand:+ start:1449 stop:2042 length:594 start_codon:yes stop_codon:yes gene_type:complete